MRVRTTNILLLFESHTNTMVQVVVAAKTTSDSSNLPSPFPPNPNSSASTITTVAREITLAGGDATAIQVDVRSPESVDSLVSQTISVSSSTHPSTSNLQAHH